MSRLPLTIAVSASNLLSKIRGLGTKYKSSGRYLWTTDSKGVVHVSANKRAALKFLSNGLDSRKEWLRREYLLSSVPIANLEFTNVVDVGASHGDFMYLVKDLGCRNYLGLEPIFEDYLALRENCQSSRIQANALNIAAGDVSQNRKIFVSRAGQDSSIIQPAADYSEIRDIQMKRLDDVLIDEASFRELPVIDLLKVEAEGFEPEVLEGAQRTLERTRYVVVDGGPERSTAAETTVEYAINFLLKRNFVVLKIGLQGRPGVAIFENLNLT